MSRSDLAKVVADSHYAVDPVDKGDTEPLKELYSKRDDVTIANPFGPPSRGWANAAETMDRAATNFREGEAIGFERISDYATADLAYTVEIEQFRSKLGGADSITGFSLRVTTVLEGRRKIGRSSIDTPIQSRHPGLLSPCLAEVEGSRRA